MFEENLPVLLQNFLNSKRKELFFLSVPFYLLYNHLTLQPSSSVPAVLFFFTMNTWKHGLSFPFYLLTLQRESMQNLTCLLYHQRGSEIRPRCIRVKASHWGEVGGWWRWGGGDRWLCCQWQKPLPLWCLQTHEAAGRLWGKSVQSHSRFIVFKSRK